MARRRRTDSAYAYALPPNRPDVPTAHAPTSSMYPGAITGQNMDNDPHVFDFELPAERSPSGGTEKEVVDENRPRCPTSELSLPFVVTSGSREQLFVELLS